MSQRSSFGTGLTVAGPQRSAEDSAGRGLHTLSLVHDYNLYVVRTEETRRRLVDRRSSLAFQWRRRVGMA